MFQWRKESTSLESVCSEATIRDTPCLLRTVKPPSKYRYDQYADVADESSDMESDTEHNAFAAIGICESPNSSESEKLLTTNIWL